VRVYGGFGWVATIRTHATITRDHCKIVVNCSSISVNWFACSSSWVRMPGSSAAWSRRPSMSERSSSPVAASRRLLSRQVSHLALDHLQFGGWASWVSVTWLVRKTSTTGQPRLVKASDDPLGRDAQEGR
jgi:hypothetical protein